MAPITHFSNGAVLYRKADKFAIKELQIQNLNINGFQVVTNRRLGNMVGCYISPRNTSTIEDVVAAITARPYWAKLLVSGDLNSNLKEPAVTPGLKKIAEELTAAGLIDMGLHFLPRLGPWEEV